MFVVQQQHPQQLQYQQQQQQQQQQLQAWANLQQGGMMVAAGGGAGTQQQVVYRTASTAQQQQPAMLYQQQQPQQQQVHIISNNNAQQQVGAENKVVLVNVNGTLQRAIVQNGGVYLLANNDPAAATVSAAPQVTAAQLNSNGQMVTLQMPAQQQTMMMQQAVLANNGQQFVPMSAGMVQGQGTTAGMQMQMQRPGPAAATTVSMGFQGAQMATAPQQPLVLTMAPAGNNAGMVGRTMMMPAVNNNINNLQQARAQQQQQVHLVQVPAQSAGMMLPAGAAARPTQLGAPTATVMARPPAASGGMVAMPPAGNNSVSAKTASLLPRMAPASTAGAPQAAHSQPMTIAAALAALPSHPGTAQQPTAAVEAKGSGELSSPVAPPGTPGMAVAGVAAAAGTGTGSNTASTIGAVISKLGAAPEEAAKILAAATAAHGAAIISGPPVMAPVGSSPLASQPGTPSRSNSVGAHSNSSSSSGLQLPAGTTEAAGNCASDADGKMAVMRMLARTFVETGIGLEQALSMIQASDRELLAAAFAAEAAAACSTARIAAASAGSSPTSPNAAAAAAAQHNEAAAAAGGGGVADLGGEQVSMPALAQGRLSSPSGLQQLTNVTVGSAPEGAKDAGGMQDSFSLGAWGGFSLFSNAASDLGSSGDGNSSFGGAGAGDKVTMAAGGGFIANATDLATATMFANLQL